MAFEIEYTGKELEVMSFATNYHRWILEEFRPFLGVRYAEIGAGVGDFSSLLLETGPERFYAFEPASNLYPQLSTKLRERAGVVTFNAFFAPETLPEPIDTMFYVNVLEHIEDDLGELQSARKALVDGGHLLIFVPALSWLFSKADRQVGHYRRYHKKQLAALVERAGFTVKECRYFDLAGIVPWYLYFVLLRGSFSTGKVVLYDRLVIPLARRFETLCAPPVGKNLLLVAQRV